MATDVKLDQVDGSYLLLEGRVVQVVGSDFMLESPERRNNNRPPFRPFRRALVHDQNDGLTINFNGDYSGGVRLVGVTEIIPQRQEGQPPFSGLTLVVRGDISYQVPGMSVTGVKTMITVSLREQIVELQAQISALSAKVEALLKK